MTPPAEIDHTEEHADLVFHQSNMKIVFSTAQDWVRPVDEAFDLQPCPKGISLSR